MSDYRRNFRALRRLASRVEFLRSQILTGGDPSLLRTRWADSNCRVALAIARDWYRVYGVSQGVIQIDAFPSSCAFCPGPRA